MPLPQIHFIVSLTVTFTIIFLKFRRERGLTQLGLIVLGLIGGVLIDLDHFLWAMIFFPTSVILLKNPVAFYQAIIGGKFLIIHSLLDRLFYVVWHGSTGAILVVATRWLIKRGFASVLVLNVLIHLSIDFIDLFMFTR